MPGMTMNASTIATLTWMAALGQSPGALAAEGKSELPPVVVLRGADNFSEYCGLYCLYNAFSAIDPNLRPPVGELISPEFLTGHYGASTDDIERACARFGFESVEFANGTIESIERAQTPTMLHVRPLARGAPYSHWILALGVDSQGVDVYDPPRSRIKLSHAEVLAIWDGVGVEIRSPESPKQGRFFGLSRQFMDDLAAFASVGALLCASGMLARGRWGRAATPLLAATAAAVAWHSLVGTGFFWNRRALAAVAVHSCSVNVPEVDIEFVADSIGRSDVKVLDARGAAAFSQSHIPGATNLPIQSGLGAALTVLVGVPKEQTIVVYCQSHRCSWADRVASYLPFLGYENVSIFRAGMNGWEERNAPNLPRDKGAEKKQTPKAAVEPGLPVNER